MSRDCIWHLTGEAVQQQQRQLTTQKAVEEAQKKENELRPKVHRMLTEKHGDAYVPHHVFHRSIAEYFGICAQIEQATGRTFAGSFIERLWMYINTNSSAASVFITDETAGAIMLLADAGCIEHPTSCENGERITLQLTAKGRLALQHFKRAQSAQWEHELFRELLAEQSKPAP